MPQLNAIGLVVSDMARSIADEVYARATAQRYAQLEDPDGVPVDLYAAL